jgi:hypothetical protein
MIVFFLTARSTAWHVVSLSNHSNGGGAYDKRYKNVLLPAINDAALEAYRVDEDRSSSIPIARATVAAVDSLLPAQLPSRPYFAEQLQQH